MRGGACSFFGPYRMGEKMRKPALKIVPHPGARPSELRWRGRVAGTMMRSPTKNSGRRGAHPDGPSRAGGRGRQSNPGDHERGEAIP